MTLPKSKEDLFISLNVLLKRTDNTVQYLVVVHVVFVKNTNL